MSKTSKLGGGSPSRIPGEGGRGPNNIVHDDENWRQRLKAENIAASQWRDSWGFLEHAKGDDSTHIDVSIPNSQLTKTVSEAGPCYPFLKQTYRQQNNKTQRMKSAEKRRELGQQIINAENRPASGKNNNISMPGSQLADRPSSPPTPPLHIESGLAISMRPQLFQDVGFSLQTDGVHPIDKYRYPLCNSHNYGWRSQTHSLEFFGVGQYGKRDLSIKRLYGWD